MSETALTPALSQREREAKRARLKEIIRQRSLKLGDFVLHSGARSSYFLDGKQTTLSAEGCALVGELIFDLVKDVDIVAIGGPTLGADPIVAAVAAESWRQGRPLDAFIVRKEPKDHGMCDRIAGSVSRGGRVAIVEDVVTKGGAIGMAIDAAREAGLEVVTAVTIVDRLEGGGEALRAQGLDFRALFTIRDFGIEPATATSS